MTTEEILAALKRRKQEITDEFERMAAPYRAALGEVERMLKQIEEHDDGHAS